jgi:Type II CAAX prenyl endopeptidase Rce1-like
MAIYGQVIHPRPNEIEFSPTYITWSVLRELLSLAALLWIGAVRGWSYVTFGFRLSWKGTAAGLMLLGVALAAGILKNFVSSSFFHPAAAIKITGASLPFALVDSIVNPVFEETLECGYYFHALRNFGKGTAVMASAIFVGFLHAYQGLNGALGVVMIRIIFGLAYWRWNNLWPLILAHSILDFLALTNL